MLKSDIKRQRKKTLLIMRWHILISATFSKKIKLWLKPKPETIHNLLVGNKWLWNIINSLPFLRNFVMKKVYTSK
jgi:hypothetical protein